MASTIALAAVVMPVTADARWRSQAVVYGYEPYYGYRYPAYYRPYARRRAYEYDHHYGLNLYGHRRRGSYQVPSTWDVPLGRARAAEFWYR